jgi:hypothetical protein
LVCDEVTRRSFANAALTKTATLTWPEVMRQMVNAFHHAAGISVSGI